jgi:hypothetical protein
MSDEGGDFSGYLIECRRKPVYLRHGRRQFWAISSNEIFPALTYLLKMSDRSLAKMKPDGERELGALRQVVL